MFFFCRKKRWNFGQKNIIMFFQTSFFVFKLFWFTWMAETNFVTSAKFWESPLTSFSVFLVRQLIFITCQHNFFKCFWLFEKWANFEVTSFDFDGLKKNPASLQDHEKSFSVFDSKILPSHESAISKRFAVFSFFVLLNQRNGVPKEMRVLVTFFFFLPKKQKNYVSCKRIFNSSLLFFVRRESQFAHWCNFFSTFLSQI